MSKGGAISVLIILPCLHLIAKKGMVCDGIQHTHIPHTVNMTCQWSYLHNCHQNWAGTKNNNLTAYNKTIYIQPQTFTNMYQYCSKSLSHTISCSVHLTITDPENCNNEICVLTEFFIKGKHC